VNVLQHEHHRSRRPLELRDQEILDVVRRGVPAERFLQLRRDASGKVTKRAQRTRYREVVAGAEQDAPVLEPGGEAPHQRGLADSRLPADRDHSAGAGRGGGVGLGQGRQCRFAFEQIHRP
jgi:hypothetical protein